MRVQAVAIVLALAGLASAASAATLVVIEARGGGIKLGQKIDSANVITLKEGERVTVIGLDGAAITMRGPFNGRLPVKNGGNTVQPRAALAALIGTRNARTNSVGVIRSGTDAAPLPGPWLIDVSRSGERCTKAGSKLVLWRPDASHAQSLSVMPIDRSWRADLEWQVGHQEVGAGDFVNTSAGSAFVTLIGDQEFTLNINTVPADLDNDFVLVSWMLEKGCMQQADALLRQIAKAQGQDDLAAKAASTLAATPDGRPLAGKN